MPREAVNARKFKKRQSSHPSNKNTREELGGWYEAKEILKEKPGRYLIAWDGVDPFTEEEYQPSWVSFFISVYTTRIAWPDSRRSPSKTLQTTLERPGKPKK